MGQRHDALRRLCRQQGTPPMAHLRPRLPTQPTQLHRHLLAIMPALHRHLLLLLQVRAALCARVTTRIDGRPLLCRVLPERAHPHRGPCRRLLLPADAARLLPLPAAQCGAQEQPQVCPQHSHRTRRRPRPHIAHQVQLHPRTGHFHPLLLHRAATPMRLFRMAGPRLVRPHSHSRHATPARMAGMARLPRRLHPRVFPDHHVDLRQPPWRQDHTLHRALHVPRQARHPLH